MRRITNAQSRNTKRESKKKNGRKRFKTNHHKVVDIVLFGCLPKRGRCFTRRGGWLAVLQQLFFSGGGDGFFVAYSLSYSSENTQLPVTISLFFCQ